jgi:endonuclease/exonuclease/phosphatase family metal-dependent hydrolase
METEMNLTRLRSSLSSMARFMGRLSIAATHIFVVTLLAWQVLRFYIAQRLLDVHRAVGRGFGFTFPEPDFLALTPWYVRPFDMMSPMVRIDYIFVSEHFIPQETHVLPRGYGSDHRPVVAKLRFAR